MGRGVSFLYGWRSRIGDLCVIEDYVQFKCPTANAYSRPYNIDIGRNVFLGRGTIIDANLSVKIGDNVLIAPNCFLTDTTHKYSEFQIPIFAQGWSYDPVRIEENVWIGAHSIILAGVAIGAGSVVAANSTVLEDVPPDTVVGGSPAKIIKYKANVS